MGATHDGGKRARRFGADDARDCVFAHRDDDDKYRRGVVGFVTGSIEYPGAARLGVEAAARTGCGMVRYVGPDAVGGAILQFRPETVLGSGRLTALVAGSGVPDLADDPDRREAVRVAIAGGEPVVLDAGALSLAPTRDATEPVRVVLTPHARELARLARRVLGPRAIDPDDARVAAQIADDAEPWASVVAEATGATVLLKGATTVVVSASGHERLRVESPTSVLATAGTGDVLAGIIGALIAIAEGRAVHERPSLARLAAAGAWIHGRAALLASARADDPTTQASRVITEMPGVDALAPVTALEVAHALPGVVGALLRGTRG